MSFKVQSDFFYTEEEVGITTSLRHTIFLVKNLQIQEANVTKEVCNWKEPSGKSQLNHVYSVTQHLENTQAIFLTSNYYWTFTFSLFLR